MKDAELQEKKQKARRCKRQVNCVVSTPINYLELNWLRRTDKDIYLPHFVFDNVPYGGFYCAPERGEILVNERYYPLDRGLIVVDIKSNDDANIINTIAHEWRHHLQFMNGMKLDSIGWDCDNHDDNYKNKIIEYFRNSVSEMDAFIYSNKIAPSGNTLQWYEWILDEH